LGGRRQDPAVARLGAKLTGSKVHCVVSAVLRASGEGIDPKRLLAKHSRHVDRVWLKGELDRRGRTQTTSGFSLSIAEAHSAAELREAVRTRLATEARLLRDLHEAGATCELDFGVMVPSEGTVGFLLDAELLSLLAADGIAVRVSAYPCANGE
jgi:hypothetical protein